MNYLRKAVAVLSGERTSFLAYQPTMHSMPAFPSWRLLMCLMASSDEPYEHIQDVA